MSIFFKHWIGWVFIALLIPKASFSRQFTLITQPCSDDESVQLSPQMARLFPTEIKLSPSNSKEAFALITKGLITKVTHTTPEAQLFGNYLVYRGLYYLKLVHYAYWGFYSQLKDKPQTTTYGLQLSVMGCLNRLHAEYPSLSLPDHLPQDWKTVPIQYFSKDQQETLWQTITSIALRKVADLGSKADLSAELALVQNAPGYGIFIQAINGFVHGQTQVAISSANRFLNLPHIPPFLARQIDAIHLNLGRVYFQLEKYTPAIQELSAVKQRSNLFSQAILTLAWAHLQKKEYSASVGYAYSLLVGELKNTYSPDAALIASIAFLENCRYPEALQSIKYFRKTYDPSYHWLYSWYVTRQTHPLNLYNSAIAFIGKKNHVPKNMGLEWIRSPLFISEQQELNLSLDEQQLSKDYLSRDLDIPKNVQAQFKKLISSFSNDIKNIQASAINKIHRELALRNRIMIQQWVEAFQNSQLIEAEIYNTAGEKFIKKYQIAPPQTLAKNSVDESYDGKNGSTLNWGRFPAAQNLQQEPETWEDELGFIKTKVTNLCQGGPHHE